VHNHVFIMAATLISVALNLIGFLTPNYTGKILDVLTTSHASMDDVWPLLLIRLELDLLAWLGNVLVGIFFALARWRTSMKCRVELFNNIMRQEIEWFSKQPAGHLPSELVHQPENMQEILSKSLADLLVGSINLVGGFVMVFSTDWRMALVGIAVRTPYIYRVAAESGRIVALYSSVQNDAMTCANALASEAISNIQVLQACSAEEEEALKYQGYIAKYIKVIHCTLYSETLLRFTRLLIDKAVDLVLLAAAGFLVLSTTAI